MAQSINASAHSQQNSWPITMRTKVIDSLRKNTVRESFKQGENKDRPGGNHHTTFRLNGFFVKAVHDEAPYNVNNVTDHKIQNMLHKLKQEKRLVTDLHFPRTHAMVKNLSPDKIKSLRQKLLLLSSELKLLIGENLSNQEKIILQKNYDQDKLPARLVINHYKSKGYSVKDEGETFDLVYKKLEKLKENISVQEVISKALNPENKNNEYIGFFMDDVNPESSKQSLSSSDRKKICTSLDELNSWLKENLGLYHWDCKDARNTVVNNGKVHLIDPAFTVEDKEYRSNFRRILKYGFN